MSASRATSSAASGSIARGAIDGFTKRYGLKMLVWFEAHDDITAAIAREKALKHFSRARKVRLIHNANPDWRELWPDIAA